MCITTVLLLLGFIIDSKNFTTFSTLQTHTMIYIVTLALDVVILNHNLALNEIIGAIIVTACVTCLTRLNAKA